MDAEAMTEDPIKRQKITRPPNQSSLGDLCDSSEPPRSEKADHIEKPRFSNRFLE
jgi:hypothetical protein